MLVTGLDLGTGWVIGEEFEEDMFELFDKQGSLIGFIDKHAIHIVRAAPDMYNALKIAKQFIEKVDLTHQSDESHEALIALYKAMSQANGLQ